MASIELIPLSETFIKSLGMCLLNAFDASKLTSKVFKFLLFTPSISIVGMMDF